MLKAPLHVRFRARFCISNLVMAYGAFSEAETSQKTAKMDFKIGRVRRTQFRENTQPTPFCRHF
jgi:hypothetical protein